MNASEWQRLLKKRTYYINELYAQAIVQYNNGVRTGQALQSVLAATKLAERADEVKKIAGIAAAKTDEFYDELKKKLPSDTADDYEKTLLDERLFWQRIVTRIGSTADDLLKLADEVALERLEVLAGIVEREQKPDRSEIMSLSSDSEKPAG